MLSDQSNLPNFQSNPSQNLREGNTSSNQFFPQADLTNKPVPSQPFGGLPSGTGAQGSNPRASLSSLNINTRGGFRWKTILTGVALLALLGGAILFLASVFLKNKTKSNSKIVLTYWGLFEPEVVMQQVISEYEAAHPNIKINYIQENLKYYRERLQSAWAQGKGPDIARIHQSWLPMLGTYLSSVPSSVYDQASYGLTFYPSAKESLTFQGQILGIPLMYDGLSLFYNEDLFRSTGKVPPKTWDELRQIAQELTARDEQGKITTAGVALGVSSNVDHWSDILGLMMLQNGANLADPSDSLASDALSYFTLFSKVDRVWDATLPSSTFAFAKGNLAMYFGPSWRVFDIKELNPDLNFKIVPVPQLPGGRIAWSSFWAEAVFKNSSYQKEAWEFLKYLSSKEVLMKLYQAESSIRLFGEPYSRQDMADLLKAQPYVGAFIEQAPYAKNWYLSSNTQDNGINHQIIKYYEDAVNSVNNGADAASALKTTSQGVAQVLGQYGMLK